MGKVSPDKGKKFSDGQKIFVRDKDEKMHRLLRPSERAKKFIHELKTGVKYTDKGEKKLDKNGNPIVLTSGNKAFRSGYLQSRRDRAACYKWIIATEIQKEEIRQAKKQGKKWKKQKKSDSSNAEF